MTASADDDVVVHGDAERAGDIDDRLGHLDVGLRRRRIAGGVTPRNVLTQRAAACSKVTPIANTDFRPR
jgi:hypothetical protein